MDFSEVLHILRTEDRAFITREIWGNDRLGISLVSSGVVVISDTMTNETQAQLDMQPYIALADIDRELCVPYTFNHDDVFATDWKRISIGAKEKPPAQVFEVKGIDSAVPPKIGGSA